MSLVDSWTRIWCVKCGFSSLIGSRKKRCSTIVPGPRPRRRVSNPFLCLGGHQQRGQEHTVRKKQDLRARVQKGPECGGVSGARAAVLSYATVGGFEIAVFSEAVPEDFLQGKAFESSSFRHFPSARRELYVELPDEDPMKQKECVGLLSRSMYGTQDASNLWQEDYTGTLAQRGCSLGPVQPGSVSFSSWRWRMLVHDFVLLADDEEIKVVE